MSSSQWCSFVKSIFLKFAGVATPPKLLRASFCTYLRSADGVDDELLESVAKAMKHQVATGGSDNYDKAAHDRLLSKAHEFCASVASKFPDPVAKIISIPGTFTGVLAADQPSGNLKLFLVQIPYSPQFYPGADMLFPAKPPLGDVKFKIPANMVIGQPIQVRVQIPADSLILTGLQIVSGPKPTEAAPPVAPIPKKKPQANQPKKSRALQQLAEYFSSDADKWLPSSSKRLSKARE